MDKIPRFFACLIPPGLVSGDIMYLSPAPVTASTFLTCQRINFDKVWFRTRVAIREKKPEK
jgi:hypothetical protein